MTGTVDIQELKRLAEAAKKITPQITHSYLWNDYMRAASPDTILALILVAEAAEKIVGDLKEWSDDCPDDFRPFIGGEPQPDDTTEAAYTIGDLRTLRSALAQLKEPTDV